MVGADAPKGPRDPEMRAGLATDGFEFRARNPLGFGVLLCKLLGFCKRRSESEPASWVRKTLVLFLMRNVLIARGRMYEVPKRAMAGHY